MAATRDDDISDFEFCTFFFLSGLAVALQLLHGDIEQLRREYMVLFTRGVSITRKLGFSDVIMPGKTPPNTLYILYKKNTRVPG